MNIPPGVVALMGQASPSQVGMNVPAGVVAFFVVSGIVCLIFLPIITVVLWKILHTRAAMDPLGHDVKIHGLEVAARKTDQREASAVMTAGDQERRLFERLTDMSTQFGQLLVHMRAIERRADEEATDRRAQSTRMDVMASQIGNIASRLARLEEQTTQIHGLSSSARTRILRLLVDSTKREAANDPTAVAAYEAARRELSDSEAGKVGEA